MMFMRSLITLAIVAGVAIEVPKYLEKKAADSQVAQDGAVDGQTTPVSLSPSNAGYTLKANEAGHFESRFRLNGKAIQALIDTGATFIAMNEQTAKSIGLGGDRLRFTYKVETANGTAQAARVTLNSVEIGSIRVRNVDAMVLRDTSLDSVLIGMSFMKKLSSWKVEGNQMQLVN